MIMEKIIEYYLSCLNNTDKNNLKYFVGTDLSFDPIFMEDAQCAETNKRNEKTIF